MHDDLHDDLRAERQRGIEDAHAWRAFFADMARDGMRRGDPWLRRLAEERYWLWTTRLRILQAD